MAQVGEVEVEITGIEDGDNPFPRDEDACEEAGKKLRRNLETLWTSGAHVEEIETVIAAALEAER